VSNEFYTNAHQSQLRRLLPDLIRSRELLLDLVWKDIRVRYRYAVMGFLWAVLEPLIMMVVLTFVFSVVFRLRFQGINGDASSGETAVIILTGLIAWQFFATALASATSSLTDNRALITKVNFPREVIPLSTVGIALVNFAIGFVLLLIVYVLLLGKIPGSMIIWIPAIFAIQFVLVTGLGMLFACLNAAFRDVGYMVNAGLLFGFYATPIFYQTTLVQNELNNRGWDILYTLYFINPMAGIVTAYREILFYNHLPSWQLMAWPIISAILALLIGAVYFRRHAPTLSDIL
jgi:homopolymeric O-antigen transport system permease protein